MPIYEYKCEECGHLFDSLRSMKYANAPIPCGKCHSDNTKRKVSSFYSQRSGKNTSASSTNCGGCSRSSCSSCTR